MSTPLVTVIVPSTRDRKIFNERIKDLFEYQTYPNKQLLFNMNEGSIGSKLNTMCRLTEGEIIVRMDSDDWYASDWISHQVASLLSSGADITGLSNAYFLNPSEPGLYIYNTPEAYVGKWVCGATMCFRREYALRWPFLDLSRGEDFYFSRTNPLAKIAPHGYIDGFIALVHKGNTQPKLTADKAYAKCGEEMLLKKIVLFEGV